MDTACHDEVMIEETSNNHQSSLRFTSARHPTPNIH
jgi:hypothetical protein